MSLEQGSETFGFSPLFVGIQWHLAAGMSSVGAHPMLLGTQVAAAAGFFLLPSCCHLQL